MNDLFFALFFLALIVLIIGLIKPGIVIRWGEKRTRKRVAMTYGIVAVAFFVLFGLTTPEDTTSQNTAVDATSTHTTHKTKSDNHHKASEKPKKEEKAAKHKKKVSHNENKPKKEVNKKKNPVHKNTTHKVAKKKQSHKAAIPAGLIPVTVTKNVDGDTIHVNLHGRDEQIRMLLIDTPEDVHPSKPVEPYGRDAAAYAERKLPVGKKIYIKPGIEKRDKYDRLLAYVFITPKDMYNYDVVKEGYARVGYVYNDTTYLSKLRAAESDAKAHHRRIWSIPGYVDNENDTYNLKIACNWASKHGESTRGCGYRTTAKSHSTNNSHSTATHHSSTTHHKSTSSSRSSTSRSSGSSSSHGKCNIKGSANHIYHVPGGAYYDRTTHVVQWFCSEAEAQKAGYRPSKR